MVDVGLCLSGASLGVFAQGAQAKLARRSCTSNDVRGFFIPNSQIGAKKNTAEAVFSYRVHQD